MDAVEIPEYFICPISLEIMKDPVTVASGITYDRQSIERWLFVYGNRICPVTHQPLPDDNAGLTPNHTLRRLIQGWCTCHAADGVDRLPTPRSPADEVAILDLLHQLSDDRELRLESLRKIAGIASESETSRRRLVHAGVGGAMIRIIVSRCEEEIELALNIFHSLRISPEELQHLIENNVDMIETLTWIILHGSKVNLDVKSTSALILKSIMEASNPRFLELLEPEVFRALLHTVHVRISPHAIKAALKALLHASPFGRNRARIIEAGGTAEIIELELTMPEKRTTELNLGILNQLCGLAEGRAEVVRHPAGIAVVVKRIFRVSAAADDEGMGIVAALARYSATEEVLQEMANAGTVGKLCLVLQGNCSSSVKEKARGILRLHSRAWKNSPCIDSGLLLRFP